MQSWDTHCAEPFSKVNAMSMAGSEVLGKAEVHGPDRVRYLTKRPADCASHER